jgi:predicted phage terminase large subunit-like protein
MVPRGVSALPHCRDQNEKTKFQTTLRGHRMAVSVGGAATGEGGDYLIVDDPHNPKKAMSEADRKTSLDWFDQTFTTRQNNKKTGVMVVVMQRLHENDLSGHLLAKGGWEHLKLSAEAHKAHTISIGAFTRYRPAGDILHPDREGPKELAQARVDLGSYGYAGQYDQEPAPLEGGVIKLHWFQRYRMPPDKRSDRVRYVLSFDTASKESELNDYSVCTVWAITPNGWYLIDLWRERVDSVDLKRTAFSLIEQWKPVAVLVEDKGSGIGLIQQLRRGMHKDEDDETSPKIRAPVVAIEPDGDKVSRAANAAPMIEAGNVYLPESAAWLVPFEAEVRNFPNATHDDQVDSVTQFVSWAAVWQYGGEAKANGEKRAAQPTQTTKTKTGWGTIRHDYNNGNNRHGRR